MSGTSMDGVDVAFLRTDGETIHDLGPALSRPYSAYDREVLRAAVVEARTLTDRGQRPGLLPKAERIVTDRHAEAIEILCADHGLNRRDYSLIGFHGQTVLHRPEIGLTVQIGNPHALAARLSRPVVYDMRIADMEAGGQGAPLAPAYHRALALRAGTALPAAFLNLGGVANITYVASGDDMLAFDTGPANALMDDWVEQRTGHSFDEGGRLAAAGSVDASRLAALMDEPYFAQPAPKSLDRDHFAARAFDIIEGMNTADGTATLLAFTVESIARALDILPDSPKAWIASGGGVSNPVLMARLSERLGTQVQSVAEIGTQPDHVEAQAFGYLAVRGQRGLPLTWPGTTGVPVPTTGGATMQPGAY